MIPYSLRYKQLINTVNEDAERLHAMMNTSQDALIQMNAKGDIVGWSAQAQNVFGWKNKQAIGQELANLIIPYHCVLDIKRAWSILCPRVKVLF
ncbi:MAG: PAS domain S-box-containing protein [Cognaticolwellia sp.]